MSTTRSDALLARGSDRSPATSEWPMVTVVIPVYNEEAYIHRTLMAIVGQDYPAHRMEILLADGRSCDRTVALIQSVASRFPEHRIVLLDNPRRTQGAALNLMLPHAAGEVIVRVDGHVEIAPDYVRRSVQALQGTDSLNVGGCIAAEGSGLVGSAIAAATCSFLGNGGARYRSAPPSRPRYVDTVQFGAWRRETLLRMGPFAEWPAGEDDEYNARLQEAGGKVLLHPAIRATYFTRATLGALARQYYRWGHLKARVIARYPRRARARQLAPPLLLLGLLLVICALALAPFRGWPVAAPPLLYLGALAGASARLALRCARPAFAAVLPAVFATLHLSYGAGMLLGSTELLATALARRLRPPRRQLPAQTRPAPADSGPAHAPDRVPAGRTPRTT